MKKSNILLLVLLVFGVSLANTVQAEKKQAEDYQKIVDKTRWRFDEGRSTLDYCVKNRSNGYDIGVEETSGFDRKITFSSDGEKLFEIEGHKNTVFLIGNGVLYIADYSPLTSGCTIIAFDLAKKTRLWKTKLKGIGMVSHSEYSNLLNIEFKAGGLLVFGKEWGGRYIELLRLADGRTIAHRAIPSALRANAKDLKTTDMVGTLEAPIVEGENLIYCATLQFAWDALAVLAGGRIEFDKKVHLAESLNRKLVSTGDIDRYSYFTYANIVGETDFKKLLAEIHTKPGGRLAKKYIEDAAELPADGAFSVACLAKNLWFKKKFEKHEYPLRFGKDELVAFGIQKYSERFGELYKQVLVLDRKSNDDFIIELAVEQEGDQLVLAKIPRGADLLSTIKSVNERISKSEPKYIGEEEPLYIPYVNFDIEKEYEELYGLVLKCENDKLSGLPIVRAVQRTLFALNESGLKLESAAAIMVLGIDDDPVEYIFDKPFLVMLKRKGRQMPYFALWVENAEILIAE